MRLTFMLGLSSAFFHSTHPGAIESRTRSSRRPSFDAAKRSWTRGTSLTPRLFNQTRNAAISEFFPAVSRSFTPPAASRISQDVSNRDAAYSMLALSQVSCIITASPSASCDEASILEGMRKLAALLHPRRRSCSLRAFNRAVPGGGRSSSAANSLFFKFAYTKASGPALSTAAHARCTGTAKSAQGVFSSEFTETFLVFIS
mmetsp:Transcript_31693/g.62061  ORF Transcript_31693/g.62061 Transcript_31693/m.62061 type:complete len:202 (-) Transcript_31693:3218-3823(-)